MNWISNVNKFTKNVPIANALDFFEKLFDFGKSIAESNIRIAEIEAKKEILLTGIEKQYNFYENVFKNIFSERKEAINKTFEIIDKGLKEGNKDIILIGMKGLSDIVTSSPFKDAKEFVELIYSNQTIEL